MRNHLDNTNPLRKQTNMSNRVFVSDDGMELVIRDDQGRQATLRSSRPEGFTEEDIDNAYSANLSTNITVGELRRCRRVSILGRVFYLHLNTGPPTWWWPRMQVKRGSVMVGWFRALVAVSWRGGAS